MPKPQPAASRARQPSRARGTPACDGTDHHRLPAAPLLQAVQQRARRRRQSLRELLGPEPFGTYGNAHTSGSISLVTLERFCDEVLGWHRLMLYGEASYEAAFYSYPEHSHVTARTRGETDRWCAPLR